MPADVVPAAPRLRWSCGLIILSRCARRARLAQDDD